MKKKDRKANSAEALVSKAEQISIVSAETLPTKKATAKQKRKAYISELSARIKKDIEDCKFNFYTAWLGFIDDKKLGYPDVYDREKLIRTLVVNGYCEECAKDFIDNCFIKEKKKDGKNISYFLIDRDETDFFWMDESYRDRQNITDIED